MDKDRRDKLIRLLLGSVSLAALPGPPLYDLFRDLTKTRNELDAKVEKALDSIRTASSVVAEVEANLKERTAKLETLRTEVERISRIAEVEEAKAAPILQEIDALVSKGRRRERVVAFAINVLAGLVVFVAGAYFGPHLFRPTSLTQMGASPTATQSQVTTQAVQDTASKK